LFRGEKRLTAWSMAQHCVAACWNYFLQAREQNVTSFWITHYIEIFIKNCSAENRCQMEFIFVYTSAGTQQAPSLQLTKTQYPFSKVKSLMNLMQVILPQ
jgi:hypothetical protein